MWLTLFLIRPECIKNASPLECKNRLFICSFRLTRKMSFREISRRRRYVCSAHQWPFRHHHPPVAFFAIIAHPWPFRHHHPPVATAPSPSRPFPASNTAYHPHSDGEAPSLRLLRTPTAFSPSPHTSGDGALAVAAVPSFQHGISSAQRRRGAVATFAPHTSSLFRHHRTPVAFFAITTHPWPFRHHRTPVATAPSPSRPFQAHSNSNLI